MEGKSEKRYTRERPRRKKKDEELSYVRLLLCWAPKCPFVSVDGKKTPAGGCADETSSAHRTRTAKMRDSRPILGALNRPSEHRKPCVFVVPFCFATRFLLTPSAICQLRPFFFLVSDDSDDSTSSGSTTEHDTVDETHRASLFMVISFRFLALKSDTVQAINMKARTPLVGREGGSARPVTPDLSHGGRGGREGGSRRKQCL